jgi:hypothetical protein
VDGGARKVMNVSDSVIRAYARAWSYRRIAMKSVLLSLWVMACSLAPAGLSQGAPMVGSATGDGTEPSQCLTDATIQITANPAQVTYGQSTVVYWSIGLPAGCSTVNARMNGEIVGLNGSRSVNPAATSTFSLLVTQSRAGAYGERIAWTQVDVEATRRRRRL